MHAALRRSGQLQPPLYGRQTLAHAGDAIALADALPRKTSFLAGRLPPQTAARLDRLLQITNTYYSNLIERQYTEPASFATARSMQPRRFAGIDEVRPFFVHRGFHQCVGFLQRRAGLGPLFGGQ